VYCFRHQWNDGLPGGLNCSRTDIEGQVCAGGARVGSCLSVKPHPRFSHTCSGVENSQAEYAGSIPVIGSTLNCANTAFALVGSLVETADTRRFGR